MIIDRINEILNSVKKEDALYIFASFVQRNFEQADSLSIQEIAQACFISKGQVSKCIRQIGYEDIFEFRDAVSAYKDSVHKKKSLFNSAQTIRQNYFELFKQYQDELTYSLQNIDYEAVSQIYETIKQEDLIYLYAQGDIRSFLYQLQYELTAKEKQCVVCDSLFSQTIKDSKGVLLLFSAGGHSFHYDPWIIEKIRRCHIPVFLITCSKEIRWDQKMLYIPSKHEKWNEMILRFVCFLLIEQIKAA